MRSELKAAGEVTSFRRARRVKPEAEIVLLCNPRAGGRWKELAAILDSDEARSARRIVTDSVEDIAPAIANLGKEAKLLCIYGGDGTVQRILDRLCPETQSDIQLAILGGGTMNVTARWCGLTRKPAENFREVVRAYETGELLFREVPLLEVRHGSERHRGFTFGMGPIARLLDAYEQGEKGKIAAIKTLTQAVSAAVTGFPASYADLIDLMKSSVSIDGEALPYERFSAVFANVTGQINPGVEPFVEERRRDSFYCAAYAVPARELALVLPMVIRGWLPMDPKTLFKPAELIKHIAEKPPIKQALPADARYVNRQGRELKIRTDETLYTIDGEILHAEEGEIGVTLGPSIKLAVSSAVTLHKVPAMAARRYFRRS